jgi:hypothetical protein
LVHGGHAFAQVVGLVANGVQASIAAFDARFKMCKLRYRAAAQDADGELVFVHGYVWSCVLGRLFSFRFSQWRMPWPV